MRKTEVCEESYLILAASRFERGPTDCITNRDRLSDRRRSGRNATLGKQEFILKLEIFLEVHEYVIWTLGRTSSFSCMCLP